MNDEEIEQFMELLKNYMIKSEIEIIKWKQRQEYYKGLAQHGIVMWQFLVVNLQVGLPLIQELK